MKPLLVAIQFWEGDMERAMELARCMAAIGEGQSFASVLLISRRDLGPIERLPLVQLAARELVAAGFQVFQHRSKRRGVGFSHDPRNGSIMTAEGPNDLWHETVNLAYEMQRKGKIDVAGTLTIEGDCWPLERDWLRTLCEGFWLAGKSVYGHVVENGELPRMTHVNGNAIFAIYLPYKYDVLGCPAHWTWDVYHAPKWFPQDVCDSPLICSDYRQSDMRPEQVYRKRIPGDERTPVLHHGCKDDSVRTASAERLGIDISKISLVKHA